MSSWVAAQWIRCVFNCRHCFSHGATREYQTCFKLWECCKLSTMMKSLSRSSVLDWFRRFKDGRKDLQDGPRSGHPLISKSRHNCKYLWNGTRDGRWELRMIADKLNVSKETTSQILRDDLRRKKIYSKFTDTDSLSGRSNGDSHHAKTSPWLVRITSIFLIDIFFVVRCKLPSEKEVSGCWSICEKHDGRTEHCSFGGLQMIQQMCSSRRRLRWIKIKQIPFLKIPIAFTK
jgi:hypothetical protein